ncbi:MAG: hypothetical protein QXK94_05765 [Candidatus Jordarchaeales archaeon]
MVSRLRDFGDKWSLEKANKLFVKGVEAEARGDLREAIKRFKEASEGYAFLGERIALADSELRRGHCTAFQAFSECFADKFKRTIGEAIEIINEARKIYIKDYTLKSAEREVLINCCVNFINALQCLVEENIPVRLEICERVMREGEACTERLEKLEDVEKAGILLFWIGLVCLRCAPWFEGKKRINVLQKAAESFSKAKKYFEAVKRPRTYLCLEQMQKLCEVMVVVEGANESFHLPTMEPKDERCRRVHRYSLAFLELETAVKEKFFAGRWQRVSDVLNKMREIVREVENSKDYVLAADVYYLLAKAYCEAFKLTTSNNRRREWLEKCYDVLKKAYMYAKGHMRSDLVLEALIMMIKVISEYVRLAESNALKIRLVNEGATYSREALNELKKLHEEAMVIGKFYNNVIGYLVAATEIETDENKARELLESAVEYSEVALEYLEKLPEKSPIKGEQLYNLAEAYYRLGRSGMGELLEKAAELAKKAHESFVITEDLVGVIRSSILSGDIHRGILKWSGEERYLRARQDYLEALRGAAVIDWKEMEGEVLVRLAELEDEAGNYVQSSEYYMQALEKFSKVIIEDDEVKNRKKEVEARANIEKGKDLLKKEPFEAASYFKKGGELLLGISQREAAFYQVFGEFLEAEAVGILKPSEAVERLRKVGRQLKTLEEKAINGKVKTLLKVCEGREYLEEGLAFYASGENAAALVKFSMAAKTLEEAAKTESDWEKIEGYVYFAKGLERFAKGQLGFKEEFLEAADFFKESVKVFVTNKMKNASLGFTDLCYGWYKLLEFSEERGEENDYIEARTHLERCLKFFMNAGLENYIKYVEGLGFLLDGERYVKKGTEGGDSAEKYYSLAEESYGKARERFLEAGYTGLKKLMEEKIQKLREERARKEYIEVIFGSPTSEVLEELKDGFAVIKIEEPADKSVFKMGDKVDLKLELVNVGEASVLLERLENAVPQEFRTISSSTVTIKDGDIVLGKEVAPWEKTTIELRVVAERKGEVMYQPVLIFRDSRNRKRYFKPRGVSILIRED